MDAIILALMPIFSLIALGYFFKKISFPHKDFWKQADSFTYNILFPSLLIYKISTSDLSKIDGFNFVLSGFSTLLLMTFILILFNKFLLKTSGESFTSIYQGVIRFNTYVFFSLVSAIFGDEGLILGAFLIAFLIPSINVFCITIFLFYNKSLRVTLKSLFQSIFKNPLILACIIGGSINFFGLYLPQFTLKTLEILSSAALPLGLLSVGVGLTIKDIKDTKAKILISSFFRLVALPTMVFFVGKFLGVEGLPLFILVSFACVPTAPSAYILAQQLGGDTKLMSSIITIQTLLSIITISIILQVIKI